MSTINSSISLIIWQLLWVLFIILVVIANHTITDDYSISSLNCSYSSSNDPSHTNISSNSSSPKDMMVTMLLYSPLTPSIDSNSTDNIEGGYSMNADTVIVNIDDVEIQEDCDSSEK